MLISDLGSLVAGDRLRVWDEGDDFGETVSTAGSISIGGRVVGEIESASDRDWFAVSLQAGETYQIDQEGNDTFAGTINKYNHG